MSKAAMQQALEALEVAPYMSNKDDHVVWEAAIATLREALAEPQGEPVAWLTPGGDLHSDNYSGFSDWTPLYTHPAPVVEPQKPRFEKTYCSQCGGKFGPGDAGFSHCSDHAAQRKYSYSAFSGNTAIDHTALLREARDALVDACGGRCNAEYNPCWQREVAEKLYAALKGQL